MLVAVALAVGLGLWQFGAWRGHRDDAVQHLSDTAPVPLVSVMGGDSPFPGDDVGRPVSLTGTWVGPTEYIEGRPLNGRIGYWVVGAVLVNGSHSAIPVVEGWSARPSATVLSGDVRVTGWLQASEDSGPYDANPNDDVLPTMTIASLVAKYPVDLFSGYVVGRTFSAAGPGTSSVPTIPHVRPEVVPSISGLTALRNLLYALQWWVFGGFAVFVWAGWCRDVLHPPEPEPDEPEPDEPGLEASEQAPTAADA
jgi:cytochrome oxidase assembly protein ShyY1